jgi:hypothetical protein
LLSRANNPRPIFHPPYMIGAYHIDIGGSKWSGGWSKPWVSWNPMDSLKTGVSLVWGPMGFLGGCTLGTPRYPTLGTPQLGVGVG